jgi:hypothetical protein
MQADTVAGFTENFDRAHELILIRWLRARCLKSWHSTSLNYPGQLSMPVNRRKLVLSASASIAALTLPVRLASGGHSSADQSPIMIDGLGESGGMGTSWDSPMTGEQL